MTDTIRPSNNDEDDVARAIIAAVGPRTLMLAEPEYDVSEREKSIWRAALLHAAKICGDVDNDPLSDQSAWECERAIRAEAEL